MKKFFTPSFFIFFIFFSAHLSAQKYAVHFTDKNDTPYSIENPEQFLSQRALARRARHNIAINEQDLPVNPQYVDALKNLGAHVPFTSKWLNCALISCPQSMVSQIEQLPFVSQVIYISPGAYGGKSGGEGLVSQYANKLEKEKDFIPIATEDIMVDYQYGNGYSQINQINGIPVHQQGYTGEGVVIAVIDAGFHSVNSLPVFSNLYSEERLVFELDVVIPNGNIYVADDIYAHGTNVLSCMAAYTNNSFVGTAPKASYALIRTEDDASEYLVECYNWAVGIEAADSIGADIINTSLGYRTFDDPSMNYTHAQVDGETPVASFAAKTAIEKGIFVTASAGNDNGSSWPWVGSPGDAKYAGTVGAVYDNGTIVYFSSIGPNGAGDPKPNICARGADATVYTTAGNLSTAWGTSFASPISCGMYACLIQANPILHPATLRDIVDETGNKYPNHLNDYGYGIPNFAAALEAVLSLATMEIINVEINDSEGNNDGRLNPGETVSLHITVKNNFFETLNNMGAVISTDNTNVTFINNTADFGTLAPTQTATISNAFTLTLSENALPNTAIEFYVTFSCNGKSIQGNFTLNVYADMLNAPQYAVHFKDKTHTPYSIENPLAYLSQRALDRRAKYGIAITEKDLPVDPDYIEKVNMTGAYVRNVSRWSNSVLVYAENDMLNLINNLDFVEKVVYVKPAEGKCQQYDIHPKWANETVESSTATKGDFEYGYALGQIQQINGVPVHKHGYTGENVLIAVLDGGFQNANNVTGFASLFESGRIVLERNVVEPNRSIYDQDISNHGTAVLSCMGGYLNGEYVGTAPQASYALIRTEDTPTEYLIEEYFWMIGVEVADSLGVDIINSSLSYTTFDDLEMDHEYIEMDGKTAIASIAAQMTAERGIFVTVSAGNSNGDPVFPWVGSPADTPEALTLAAVNLNGEIAGFSSLGPNGAGYPKPDVAACGWGTAILKPDNSVGTASGTSFSSPITCGMVACVIQAAPTKTPAQIVEAVQKSADRYPQHDIQYGYGIPNFEKVLQILGVLSVEDYKNRSSLIYYPNPVSEKLFLSNDTEIIKNIELYDITGRIIKNINANSHQIFVDVKEINAGFLFVKVVYDNGESEMVKCAVLKY
jgi:hypothetical protein